MSSSTRWRIGATVVVGALAAAAMVLLGMEPRLALVACIVAAAGGATWLVVDVGAAAAPVVWSDPGATPDESATTDRRVQALRGWLRRPARSGRRLGLGPADAGVPSDEIADVLLAVLDDVLAEHGIDRATDPAAADRFVGPDLARFVDDPAARRSMTQRRALARTLALIEDLPSSPSLD